MQITNNFSTNAKAYLNNVQTCFDEQIICLVEQLANDLKEAWINGRHVFICGNGGSAANAIHMANDLHYGVGACGPAPQLPGIKVEALSSNAGIITCLANDTGYENIYSHQLEVKGESGDLLIVLSGSGNSANVVNALKKGKEMDLKSYAILAFNGGLCRSLADVPIHFKIDDMQIAEDTQLIIGHLCMQWLTINKPQKIGDS